MITQWKSTYAFAGWSWLSRWKSIGISVLAGFVFQLLPSPGIAQTSVAEAQEHLNEIARTLPHTAFRELILRSRPGTGVREDYMDRMTKAGVKRSLIEVHGIWRSGFGDPTISSRRYFSNYDGRGTEITDPQRLSHDISLTGLQDVLDQVALVRIKRSGPFCQDECPDLEGKKVYGVVELYDDPWLLSPPTAISSEDSRHHPLLDAAASEDVTKLHQALANHNFSQRELDTALFQAVYAERDNTEVMEILMRAGANVNARSWGVDHKTLLMAAIYNPVHVLFLLKSGARIDDKDAYGNTALVVAEMAKERESVKILEQANRH